MATTAKAEIQGGWHTPESTEEVCVCVESTSILAPPPEVRHETRG